MSTSRTSVFMALIKLDNTEHINSTKNENKRDIVLLMEVIVPKTFESIFFRKKYSKLLE
ncbi:hypothetical protein [Borrelia sp. RT5S]|uniref:hypothetical protein n=1 Tax=Borrelia sp. RT5S TaxID=2898581 RepID=UPI001E488749|nr:hypothetical protein [Borrelia sp. RT5S]UGQ16493.1 hypothetical protein LSO06_04420 [Borrelia sp. RT5S]